MASQSLKQRTSQIYFLCLTICVLYFIFSSSTTSVPQISAHEPVSASEQIGTPSFNAALRSSSQQPLPTVVNSYADTSKYETKTSSLGDKEPWTPPGIQGLKESRMDMADGYVTAIMDPKDVSFARVLCPSFPKERYAGLQSSTDPIDKSGIIIPRYFFALNLFNCSYVLPRLLGSIIETMNFLGPDNCVLSIVGGRSDDGTTEILARLRDKVEAMGSQYYFSTSDIDPLKEGNDRVEELGKLRNLALEPLVRVPEARSPDSTVIFLNDVSICANDILELVYQKVVQGAHMVCAFDWINEGSLFYDVWVARGMTGDLFFEIPQSGSWEFAGNLFWNDLASRAAFDAKIPFQVYACWNGAVAFTAEPLLLHRVAFRSSRGTECYMGEPTLFCKDLWAHGYGRIAVVPSVNIAYDDEQSRFAKNVHGNVSDIIETTEIEQKRSTLITWRADPPTLIKCDPDFKHPTWVSEKDDKAEEFAG